MSSDSRADERRGLDALTREFLEKGGSIQQCPPGASESVVYRRGTFRKRSADRADARNSGQGDSGKDDASVEQASTAGAPVGALAGASDGVVAVVDDGMSAADGLSADVEERDDDHGASKDDSDDDVDRDDADQDGPDGA